MALLSFTAASVAAQIAHARGCSTFLPNWNGPVGQPALILIVGNGVHLRSNGIDGTSTRIVTTERADPSYAFAEGINPFRDPDWMAARQAAFRDLTGQFYTDILDDVQMLIDRGHDTGLPRSSGPVSVLVHNGSWCYGWRGWRSGSGWRSRPQDDHRSWRFVAQR